MPVITGTNTNNTLNGTSGDDQISALDGNDLIFGSTGLDSIDGGNGDDFLLFRYNTSAALPAPGRGFVLTITDTQVIDNLGQVNSIITGIENIGVNLNPDFAFDVSIDASGFTPVTSPTFFSYFLTGTGNDTIVGTSGNDLINAREGSNTVDAGAGTDEVVTYLNDTGETVFVTGTQATAFVTQGGQLLLQAQNAETISVGSVGAIGSRTIDASGLVGASFTASMGAGADTFVGSAQDDAFFFDFDGTAADVLTGGSGSDRFVVDRSNRSFDNVTITDFGSGDFIDFLDITDSGNGSVRVADPIPVTSFHFGPFTNQAGELIYTYVNGQTLLQYDADGDGVADQTLTFSNGQLALEAEYITASNGVTYFNGIRANTAGVTITLTDGDDTFVGTPGDDTVFALRGDDVIEGGDGNDFLDGGLGNDTVSYAGATAGVTVYLAATGPQNTGGAGTDTLRNFENIIGSNFDDRLFGTNRGVNIIEGGLGNDQINGGFRNDYLYGGMGDDSVYGSGGDDSLWGDDGNDFLLGGSGIDRLYGGAGDDRLNGGADYDVLEGGDGNDRLDGGTGNDRMIGGAGNDLYFVNEAGDVVIENAGEGIDTVRVTGIDYTLGDNVENLNILFGTVNGTGNALDNILVGSASSNTLMGMAGDDTLRGMAGNDILMGGDGDDRLFGGSGRDTLTGGAGTDDFYFLVASDSSRGSAGADRITDFSQADGDRISLAGIDAITGGSDDAFTFIGMGEFTNVAGQLRYMQDGTDTIIMADVDGDGVADMSIVLTGTIDLVAGDFVL